MKLKQAIVLFVVAGLACWSWVNLVEHPSEPESLQRLLGQKNPHESVKQGYQMIREYVLE